MRIVRMEHFQPNEAVTLLIAPFSGVVMQPCRERVGLSSGGWFFDGLLVLLFYFWDPRRRRSTIIQIFFFGGYACFSSLV
ncbi:hypothetical protein BO82DRAFT_86743 [Aspergillus uvarum CBS 121591]|uniref:Uncharacterized protein n=1 Tax=Aspergillus uvarum CBS 121591 TaxID=1448315 RepID=A0A319CMJ4_9EURO|nr:hypothetical protein BO82DRAFT_86743 [Aspergillus uvarum CBS 121591]PYH86414.1 hypothetical protein BO82DRAFT_86743 [Aspergillus uvarum CBS 121591]